QYGEYEFFIPDYLMEKEILMIKLEVIYGEGSGSAARLFIDDFRVHGLLGEEPGMLEIVSIDVIEESSLVLGFNQNIQLSMEYVQNSIFLSPSYGSPVNVRIDKQSLILEFADYLYSNQYELILNHLATESGEEIWIEKAYEFDISTPTPKGTVLINEFMADPNPKGIIPEEPVLPNSTANEYIELFNTTNKPISLRGFRYNNGELNDFTLDSGAFVLLTSSDNSPLFSPFAQTIPVTPFRTLANAEGSISIEDAFGNMVDSISYSKNWYTDPQKANG